MRVLSIGTDRKLFEEGSLVRGRQKSYARRLGTLDIIVFTLRRSSLAQGERATFGTVTAIPTNSWSKLQYGFDAWRIAMNLDTPDVITSQDPFETGLVALFVAWWLGVPLHVQVHTDFMSRAFSRASFANWLRAYIAWFVLRRAARIRTILYRTAEEIRARGITAPIATLPIFVDTERFAAIPRSKHPRWKIALLCVGRFEKEKRFEIAIDVLAAARTQGHDVGLTLVGEGSLKSRLYQYAQQQRVADRLEIVGWKNDLARQYAEADIVLVPSHYEGYGLVIVEALAAGIPVLATDVGVAREAGAIVVLAEKFPQAFAQWIKDGPRKATLAQKPYTDLEEYVRLYCEDIESASRGRV
jgi:glycosyltransferase involved in cell wall biosynthesis